MLNRRFFLTASSTLALGWPAMAAYAQGAESALDHKYAAWDALLKKHVRWLPDNKQSQVDYKAFAADRAALQQVLVRWSAVTPAKIDVHGALESMEMGLLPISQFNGRAGVQ